MSFVGSIRSHHREVRCEISQFALAIPVLNRLEGGTLATAERLLSLVRELHGQALEDCTLDGFLELMQSDALVIACLITHYDCKLGALEFRDGFWPPELFASRLSRIREHKLLDMTCCLSHQVIAAINRQKRMDIDIVRVSNKPADIASTMLFCEALVRLLRNQGAIHTYREIVLRLFDTLPSVLKLSLSNAE